MVSIEDTKPTAGVMRTFNVVKVPLRDADGKIVGLCGIARDITERKKMEEELLKVEKLESLGILAGGIAHDFNNILTGILGNISVAKLDLEPENEIFQVLTDAERATTQAKGLTQQLLTFSKGGLPVKETIKELLRIDPDVKAIVSSGYPTDPIMANYKDYGFKDVVAKPYEIKELSKTLHSVIGD